MCISKPVRTFLLFLSFLMIGFQFWLCPNQANFSPKLWAEHAGMSGSNSRVSFTSEVVQKTQWWTQSDFMSLSPAKEELIFHLERAQAPQTVKNSTALAAKDPKNSPKFIHGPLALLKVLQLPNFIAHEKRCWVVPQPIHWGMTCRKSWHFLKEPQVQLWWISLG